MMSQAHIFFGSFSFSLSYFWQFQSTINKIRASKKAANYGNAADADFDEAVDSFKRRNRTEFKSTLDNGIGHAASSIRKSAYKVSMHFKTLHRFGSFFLFHKFTCNQSEFIQ